MSSAMECRVHNATHRSSASNNKNLIYLKLIWLYVVNAIPRRANAIQKYISCHYISIHNSM